MSIPLRKASNVQKLRRKWMYKIEQHYTFTIEDFLYHLR